MRADNGGIVGAFVLKGEPKAWGLSKCGYCASIDGKVTIGVADNSPLFGHAIYLVGSTAYGWAVDREGIAHEFGEDNFYTGRRRMPKNTSYIVWRRK